MKRWAVLVVFLYAAVLADLLIGAVALAFGHNPLDVVKECYWREWAVLGAWVLVMALAQAALLVVPIRLAGQRPVRQRHIFWSVLPAVFLLLLMTVTLVAAVGEALCYCSDVRANRESLPWFLAVVLGSWAAWSGLFACYTGVRPPRTFLARTTRVLLAGSILELLVAVPAHVYARARNDCCGGVATIWGIGAGISVMLLAFGPGAFFLLVRRYASLRRPAPGRESPAGTPTATASLAGEGNAAGAHPIKAAESQNELADGMGAVQR